MPNPMRIAYPGALYHIVSRGNDRRDIFIDDADRGVYLDLLHDVKSIHNIKVYAYALMSNHVHIFIKTVLPNISAAICSLHLGYSKYFNKRHGHSGHIFGTRFKSKLVQRDRYFLALLRYIHMNPVKAGMAATPEQYAWSSHLAYLCNTDRIISDPKETLLLFSDNLARARAAYLEFLRQPIPEKEWETLNKERNGILGDAAFRRSCRQAASALCY